MKFSRVCLVFLLLTSMAAAQTGRYIDSLNGLLHEADGSLVIAAPQAGARFNSRVFLTAPNGSLVVSNAPRLVYALVSGNTTTAPTVTPTCTGTCVSTWGYTIVAFEVNGNQMGVSTEGTTAANATTLDGTHTNTVTWASVSQSGTAASTYSVYRTTVATIPSQKSLVCSAVADASRTCTDNGSVVTADAVPGAYKGTAGDATVYSYALPAGTLSAGQWLDVDVGLQCNPCTSASKTSMTLAFGATPIASSSTTVTSTAVGVAHFHIYAVSGTSQYAVLETVNLGTGTVAGGVAQPAETLANTLNVVFKFNWPATEALKPKFLRIAVTR